MISHTILKDHFHNLKTGTQYLVTGTSETYDLTTLYVWTTKKEHSMSWIMVRQNLNIQKYHSCHQYFVIISTAIAILSLEANRIVPFSVEIIMDGLTRKVDGMTHNVKDVIEEQKDK
jgi:hypothetical protein